MKALLLTAPRELEITDVERPELPADEVMIRVAACGICGSDVHGYDGSSGRRIPPLVMGHEAAGVVERVGNQVSKFQPGDRVTFDSTIYCGHCRFCQRGQVNLCDNRQVMGVSCGDYRRHGAFAEYVVVPERVLYRLPDALPFEHAAMIEAVSVAVHAVGQVPLVVGDVAVVVGSGMIGLLVIQALRAAGCDRIVAVDVEDDRLKLAQQLGAEHTVNAKTDDPVEFVHKITNVSGADVALEVVGTSATLQTALAAVRKGGAVTLVGNISPQVEMPLQSVVTREIKLFGSCASAGEYPQCIELMASGQIDVAPLISNVAPLEEGSQWFDRLYKKEPGLMKVVLTP